ncbi:MAG: hypothetical protein WBB67_02635 [bacterium]
MDFVIHLADVTAQGEILGTLLGSDLEIDNFRFDLEPVMGARSKQIYFTP